MNDSNITVGKKLRRLREERGYSQREMAELAGLSTNAISLIERDVNSPSVATLQSLARALNVRMTVFFEKSITQHIIVARSGERPHLNGRGTRIETAGQSLRQQEIEPFIVTLEPGSGSGERQVVHAGHEFVHVLEGSLEYTIDNVIYRLESDDSLLFEARLPHRWRNPGGLPARFLLLLQSPFEVDETIDQHFTEYPSLSFLG